MLPSQMLISPMLACLCVCDVQREVKVNSPPFNQASLLVVVCVVSRFSPPTTPNADVSWRRSSVLTAPPTPRCCSTPRTWIRCHTGSQTCRDSARTSAASSTTPAGGTYQVITQMIMTMGAVWITAPVRLPGDSEQTWTHEWRKQAHAVLSRYSLCRTFWEWNWHLWLGEMKIHIRLRFSLRLSSHM